MGQEELMEQLGVVEKHEQQPEYRSNQEQPRSPLSSPPPSPSLPQQQQQQQQQSSSYSLQRHPRRGHHLCYPN